MDLIIPPPCQSCAVIGHDDAKRQLGEAYASGKMHHAWLLTGPEGIGKATLAYHAAHMVLSGGQNGFERFNPDHPAARLIAAESHPDLFVLRRPFDDKTGIQKETIPVDEARKIAPFLSMTASFGSGRVTIIDEAHCLGRNGQNAILKMIEEPPTGATIFMTATTIGALLPTIRSRCRVLKMDALTPAQLRTIMARLSVEVPEGMNQDKLFAAASGSIGLALRLLETEALDLYEELLAILSFLPTLDLVRLHKLADQIGKKGNAETFAVLTNSLVDALRQAARAVALGTDDPTGLAAKLSGARRLDKALQLWESTDRTFAVARGANLDNKLAFINAVSGIAQAVS